MRRSLSGLYQEMLLQCIPKLWKLRILVIKFWQCFYRLKCIFWSFVYFFTNFRSFFFCLTIRVIPLVSKTMWYEQSNQSTCNQIVITWSLTSGFQVCWKGQCLESALTFCVQIDHVTPHSNWLDFVYFFPCGVFANGQWVTWVFLHWWNTFFEQYQNHYFLT